MERKIIFLDIDGTLTEPGKNIPPDSALEAIRRARQNGHLVFLCSGRSYGMLSPLLAYPFDGAVASSGGHIRCGGKVIFDCPMSFVQQKTAIEVLKKNGVFLTLECLDGAFTDGGLKEFLRRHISKDSNSEMLRWMEQIESSMNILPISEYRGQPVYKMVLMCERREQLEEPRAVLGKDFFFSVPAGGRYGFTDAELVNRCFDKGKAVCRVCEHLGISVADSIGFGDSVNDREMMQAAGLSICMGNGSDELKRIADEVCPPVTEDGLYRAFLAHGLI